jgi:signal peptidase I
MYCSGREFGELAKVVLETGSSLRFEATGSSMHPAVRNGDLLLITALPPGELRTGDVVLARLASDRLLVHRIVQRQRRQGTESFLLKGDRSPAADGWLPAGAILGKVTHIQRGGASIALGGTVGRLFGYLLAGMSRRNLSRVPLVRATPRLLARLARLARVGQKTVRGLA